MNDLISVIVPAYNAAARIKFTLESIISQDYDNLEIIVIDDASQDNTGSIVRKILENSSRKINIITHDHNRGECASRNTGLANANGKYICFIDGDDLICENFVSSLHNLITSCKCDIVFCGLINRFTNRKHDENIGYSCKEGLVSSGENLILKNLRPSICCCLYNAEFLRKSGLLFHEGCSAGGDVEFVIKTMCKAEKVTFTNRCLYIYMHHVEMGSVRDNNTKEKKLTRYKHNTQAQIRTADFLIEHSSSERVKLMAEKILQPQNIIRQSTIFAAEHDKEKYNSLRDDEYTMKILHRALSFYVFMNKPEVFFKAIMLLYFPEIYYKFRALRFS